MGNQQVSEWFRGTKESQRPEPNWKQGENGEELVSIEEHGLRENSRRELIETRLRAREELSRIDASHASSRLAVIATTTLGGLLVVLALFDFLGQAFFFAQLLETSEHLFDAFAATGLDSNRHLVKFLTLR